MAYIIREVMRLKASVSSIGILIIALISLVAYSRTTPAKINFNSPSADFINKDSTDDPSSSVAVWISVYHGLRLDSLGLSATAFEQALKGWEKLKQAGQLKKDNILTIADFSQPSTNKRLYIVDIEQNKLLYNTYVAHGRNSGKEQALNYSNKAKSHKSSPGFYRTESTYYGGNGYSLKLAGLEKGINDNAFRRAIVIHGADYVSESLIESQGFLGRSYGCPAIPTQLTRPIINTIKEGTCLFIYAPVKYYAQLSSLAK